jgi:hypothetical protein
MLCADAQMSRKELLVVCGGADAAAQDITS